MDLNTRQTNIDASFDSTITDYLNKLDKTFSIVIKQYNNFQLSDHTKESVDNGRNILMNIRRVISPLREHLKSFQSIICDCNEYIEYIMCDLTTKPPGDGDYVYSTKNGMLSYKEREIITLNELKQSVDTISQTHDRERVQHTHLKKPLDTRVWIPPIKYKMNIDKVKKLSDIPPMFYFCNDKQYGPGIYCAINKNIIAKVPFNSVYDVSKTHDKSKSIKCKYLDINICLEHRKKMAAFYKTDIRKCTFAHTGEKMVKMGYNSRCNIIPSFGNPKTLLDDITYITEEEIKTILMYGLNDLFSAAVWGNFNKVKKILVNIDIA